jgi:hypothetical protein
MIISSKKKKNTKYARLLQTSWQFHNFHCKNVAIFFGIFFPQKRVSLAMLLGTLKKKKIKNG